MGQFKSSQVRLELSGAVARMQPAPCSCSFLVYDVGVTLTLVLRPDGPSPRITHAMLGRGAGLCGTLWYTLRRSLHLGLALDSTVLATPVLGCSVPEAEHGAVFVRSMTMSYKVKMHLNVHSENAYRM